MSPAPMAYSDAYSPSCARFRTIRPRHGGFPHGFPPYDAMMRVIGLDPQAHRRRHDGRI